MIMKRLLINIGKGMGSLNESEEGSGPNRGLNSRGNEKKANQVSPCMKTLNKRLPVPFSCKDGLLVSFINNQLDTNIG